MTKLLTQRHKEKNLDNPENLRPIIVRGLKFFNVSVKLNQ